MGDGRGRGARQPVAAGPSRLWASTGASPVGLAFRGRIDPALSDEFWLYDALGPRIWIHRDNERHPERPLVFVLETAEDEMEQRRPRTRMSGAAAHCHPGHLVEIRLTGPSPPPLQPFAGPPIVHEEGPHGLELVVEVAGSARPVSAGLVIRS